VAEVARRDAASGGAILGQHPDRFVWNWYGRPEQRERLRRDALARFLLDLDRSPGRYVAAALPRLPFRDGSFGLAVCSHLLFTWADQLGLEWHRAALRELTRVAVQVRVFPTVVQGAGEPVPFWDELMRVLADDGLVVAERRVDYEFQRGADRMLVAAARGERFG
jgi:SAM-dependent methyltransferase